MLFILIVTISIYGHTLSLRKNASRTIPFDDHKNMEESFSYVPIYESCMTNVYSYTNSMKYLLTRVFSTKFN